MEDDCLKIIIEMQGQILALRRAASAFTDPKLQELYLTIADKTEEFAREFDRAAS